MPPISPLPLLMLAAITLTGCSPMAMTAGATEQALCTAWGGSLPSRSHRDTAQTADEIALGYAVFAASCPEFEHLIPMKEGQP